MFELIAQFYSFVKSHFYTSTFSWIAAVSPDL